MSSENLAQLTDQELLEKAKKFRSAYILNCFLIGFCIGVVIFSIFKSTWGLFTLILLFFVYKLINKSRTAKNEIETALKLRGIK